MAKDSFVNRAISFIFPVIIERSIGEKDQELEVTLENGRLVLNSAIANYSFGSLHRVWSKAIDAIGLDDIDKILLLGGGVGSVPYIIHNRLKSKAHITLVEHDCEVIRLGQQYFDLQNSDRVQIEHQDAFKFCQSADKAEYDLIMIDLFKDLNVPQAVGGVDLWNNLDRLLTTNGVIALNAIAHDNASRSTVEEFKSFLSERYSSVQELELFEINRIFIIQAQLAV